MMSKKASNCAICDNSNRASICAVCVNYRLNEYNSLLKSLKNHRDLLYSKLNELIAAKGKADDQLNWRVRQSEKLTNLKEKLRRSKEQLAQGKVKIERVSHELKVKYGVLKSARGTLEKNRVEKLEKFYPNLICTQSLGHMAITSERLHKQSVVIKQICKLFPQRRLLNLVVHNLAAPALHNSGFAGSCSRIWQRDSYWDARPSSRSNEYPLFIPRQNYCSTSGDNSWTDKSSSNFGVASMESERRPHLDSINSFNYSSTSPHTVETHKDLQKGISLLKKSVACVTTYCYNSLCLDVPTESSTFEAFSKLLATLSSTREVRSVFSLKMACSRSGKRAQQLNKSVWNKNLSDHNLPSSAASFLFGNEISDNGKNESLIDGWDIVEHPTFPPPPSETEDIEHWTRAMFIDATSR
ncbi:Lon protease [Gossypium arboreum]|uniref:Lon protease n=1 Tax=Gossypium arboreum TaxID=29729 RepID=A0A0B0NMN2_GOSAR|nr:Lon protease [Gossypium arboreum]